jgi:hypothetical protein
MVTLFIIGVMTMIGIFFFNVFPCTDGHVLPKNSRGDKIPRHSLTHCARCGVYLGEEKVFPNIKIKGYEKIPYTGEL